MSEPITEERIQELRGVCSRGALPLYALDARAIISELLDEVNRLQMHVVNLRYDFHKESELFCNGGSWDKGYSRGLQVAEEWLTEALKND